MTKRECNRSTFAPDSSGKLWGLEDYFFLAGAERPEEAPDVARKKRLVTENLQRIAGLGPYFIYVKRKKIW